MLPEKVPRKVSGKSPQEKISKGRKISRRSAHARPSPPHQALRQPAASRFDARSTVIAVTEDHAGLDRRSIVRASPSAEAMQRTANHRRRFGFPNTTRRNGSPRMSSPLTSRPSRRRIIIGASLHAEPAGSTAQRAGNRRFATSQRAQPRGSSTSVQATAIVLERLRVACIMRA
jgi:hypothetical protein